MTSKIKIVLTEKEAIEIRELLISLSNAKYATDRQQVILFKMIEQINGDNL